MLLFSCIAIYSQEAVVSVRLHGNGFVVTAELNNVDEKVIFQSLKKGLKSEISFQIRLYQKHQGVLNLFGDRLISEVHPFFTAQWDPFDARYILTDGKVKSVFSDPGEFIKAFFKLEKYYIGVPKPYAASDCYLMVQIQLLPVKFVAPLNIFSLVKPFYEFLTPWVRYDIITQE